MRPGWNASSPIAMKRNEAPQMSAREMKRLQSAAEKASRLVPWEVEMSLVVAIA
jgi:hypothetical protein